MSDKPEKKPLNAAEVLQGEGQIKLSQVNDQVEAGLAQELGMDLSQELGLTAFGQKKEGLFPGRTGIS